MNIQRLKTGTGDFFPRLDALLAWDREQTSEVDEAVRGILSQVRTRGDQALLEYTNRWDRRNLKTASDLLVPPSRLAASFNELDPGLRQALEASALRIWAFHQRQLQESWTYAEADGSILGQRVTPLDRVGVYVPGGKAAYPSSVLMNIIPAKVAGVEEIIMAAPAPDDRLDPTVLAAAALAGVDRVYTIGGAQAVAALAFGTQTVPKVDKIVGPGNIYVARAKAMVFGSVGIDMIAGPSEILIVCDGGTEPDWIAMDLFAQAEHDEQAQAILVSPEAGFLDKVEDSILRQIEATERAPIIRRSLASRGAFIEVKDLEEAACLVNYIAPEHLELSVADPEALLPQIRHAGAIFMGRYTAEALGDYCAGPNHILPTARTARFSSPLGVYDFQKRSSLVHCSERAAKELGRIAATLAHAEGLTAHARSAEYRVNHE